MPASLADALVPRASAPALARARDVALVAAGAALVAGCAQVTIPWHPVPFTGQTFAVLLAGGLLGAARGALAMALYWALIATGLPLMAGGAGGIEALGSPTGGYVLGFIVAAGLVGAVCERGGDRRPLILVGALLLGQAAIYAVGVPWLALCEVVPGAGVLGLADAYRLGLEPFLLGDAVKLAAVAGLLPAGWALLAGRGRGRGERHRPR